MKKFLSGLIIGVLITTSLTVYAAVEYSIIANPFPIYVNEKMEDVEALNINGSTWIRLGSIAKVLNASVIFDEVSSQINITTGGNNVSESATNETQIDSNTMPQSTEKPNYYTKDGLEMMDYRDTNYIKLGKVMKASPGIHIQYDGETRIAALYKSWQSFEDGKDAIIESIPYILVSDRAWIDYDYYTDTILPLIQE